MPDTDLTPIPLESAIAVSTATTETGGIIRAVAWYATPEGCDQPYDRVTCSELIGIESWDLLSTDQREDLRVAMREEFIVDLSRPFLADPPFGHWIADPTATT